MSSYTRELHSDEFSVSHFLWRAQILSLATNAVSCFSWPGRLTLFNSEIVSITFLSLNGHNLSFFFPSKIGVLWKKNKSSWFTLPDNHMSSFPLTTGMRKSVIWTHFITQYQRFVLKVWEFIKLVNFIASWRTLLSELALPPLLLPVNLCLYRVQWLLTQCGPCLDLY